MGTFRSIEITTAPDTGAWLDDLLAFYLDEHIRYNEGTAEDGAHLQHLDSALALFEEYTNGRTVLSTTFTEYKPTWAYYCDTPMRLSRAKVTAVTSVEYHDASDVLQQLDADEYGVDLTGTPALVWLLDGASWPSLNQYRPRPIAVEYTAGWAPSEVPSDIKHAVFLCAAHFYEYRGDTDAELPDGFLRFCRKYHTGLDVFTK